MAVIIKIQFKEPLSLSVKNILNELRSKPISESVEYLRKNNCLIYLALFYMQVLVPLCTPSLYCDVFNVQLFEAMFKDCVHDKQQRYLWLKITSYYYNKLKVFVPTFETFCQKFLTQIMNHPDFLQQIVIETRKNQKSTLFNHFEINLLASLRSIKYYHRAFVSKMITEKVKQIDLMKYSGSTDILQLVKYMTQFHYFDYSLVKLIFNNLDALIYEIRNRVEMQEYVSEFILESQLSLLHLLQVFKNISGDTEYSEENFIQMKNMIIKSTYVSFKQTFIKQHMQDIKMEVPYNKSHEYDVDTTFKILIDKFVELLFLEDQEGAKKYAIIFDMQMNAPLVKDYLCTGETMFKNAALLRLLNIYFPKTKDENTTINIIKKISEFFNQMKSSDEFLIWLDDVFELNNDKILTSRRTHKKKSYTNFVKYTDKPITEKDNCIMYELSVPFGTGRICSDYLKSTMGQDFNEYGLAVATYESRFFQSMIDQSLPILTVRDALLTAGYEFTEKVIDFPFVYDFKVSVGGGKFIYVDVLTENKLWMNTTDMLLQAEQIKLKVGQFWTTEIPTLVIDTNQFDLHQPVSTILTQKIADFVNECNQGRVPTFFKNSFSKDTISSVMDLILTGDSIEQLESESE